jgi:hypothetical protein
MEILTNLGVPNLSNPELSETEKATFIELLYKNSDLFAVRFDELPGTNVDIKHEIRLTDNTPIRLRPYRHSPKDNEIIE